MDATANAAERLFIRRPDGWLTRMFDNKAFLVTLCMLPTAGLLLVFLTYPLGLGLWLSMTDATIGQSGHFIGYGLIGLAWLRAWWMTLPDSRFLADTFLGLMGTALIASADEFHQSFLPNRTASPWDVLIDCSGALTLQLMVYIFMRINRPKRLMRAA